MPNLLKSTRLLAAAVVAFVLTGTGATQCLAANETYSALPPFIAAGAKANVVFVIDYSGSMQGPAYTDGWFHSYTNSRHAIYAYQNQASTEYDQGTEYYGYFDSSKYYSYNSGQKYWEEDPSTPYSGMEPGNKDSLSGNFLNFLVTTRVDSVLKNLTGGKAECPSGQTYCILESQGSYRYTNVPKLHATCLVTPEHPNSGDYTGQDMLISVGNYNGNSLIGTFSNRFARVKIDAKDRKGIIQDNFDAVQFGFIGYATSANSTTNSGRIRYGLHQSNQDDLISSLEGCIPYGGTNTGEAMREAYYYLKQDSSTQSYNDPYVSKGTALDPYYEEQDPGTFEPVPCRKSFVVLISDGEWNGGQDPDLWTNRLHSEDLRTDTGLPSKQNADVFSLFVFADSVKGERSMKTVAAFGGYDELSGCGNNTPYTLSTGDDSRNNVFPRANRCVPGGTYHACCAEWDSKDNDGSPDNFYFASDGKVMTQALTAIFNEIRQGTASSTAVSALTSRISSGNVMTQGAFYPTKKFKDDKTVVWTGDVFGEWFLNAYIYNASGEQVLVQNAREDSDGDYVMSILDDRILEYLIESEVFTIKAHKSTQYGEEDSTVPPISYSAIEEVNNLFDSGELLRTREPSTRVIYGVNNSDLLEPFTAANATDFKPMLGNSASEYPSCLVDSGTPKYEDLISYTRGEDIANCRPRVTDAGTGENVWKLGDIISSSPTIVEYDDYAMVYVGSNAGMLHAFRMGYIRKTGDSKKPAQLCDEKSGAGCTNTTHGVEEWAFVPKDAMPYLRYMADPSYDHMYSVDLKPFIVDTGSKKILIGGMRLGGACDAGSINPPSDTGVVGRSAYFALDITDPVNPKYLWRYAPDGMGFTYSGPGYVKRQDSSGNWKHFLLFASGPTGYDGTSVQDLKIFTVDLLTGTQMNVYGTDPGEKIANAFGGRLFTNGMDINDDGQTDFVLLGISKNADSGDFTKHKGGMIKIYTGSDNPVNWDYDQNYLAFATDPITVKIESMDCFPDQIDYPYIYFGTGRFFVTADRTGSTVNDLNRIYGVPFIYDENNNTLAGGVSINSAASSDSIDCNALNNIDSNPAKATWYRDLEPFQSDYLRERLTTDPSPSDGNVIFFTTNEPTSIPCECGGRHRTWIANCATGQAISTAICSGSNDYKVDKNIQYALLIQTTLGNIESHKIKNDGTVTAVATGFTAGLSPDQPSALINPPSSVVGQMLYWKQW